MSDRQLKICKNTGICTMAGCPVWTNNKKCSLCARKLKRIQMSDRDYNNLEMRAVEDPMDDRNNDDRSTKSFPGDFRGRSQSGYQGNPHRGNGGTGYVTHTTPVASDEFTCADAFVEGCPLERAKPQPVVRIPWATYKQWQFLALKFKTEWLMYLHGTYNEDTDEWTITGQYVPKQKVTMAHVDVDPGQIKPDTIGDVHSHNTMSAFFSGEDKKHFNWPVHLVINARGDICANVGVELECGRQARVDAKVLWFEDGTEMDSAIKAITENIREHSYATVPNSPRIPATTVPATEADKTEAPPTLLAN